MRWKRESDGEKRMEKRLTGKNQFVVEIECRVLSLFVMYIYASTISHRPPFTATQDSNVFEPVDKAYAFVNEEKTSLILKQVMLHFISYSCF